MKNRKEEEVHEGRREKKVMPKVGIELDTFALCCDMMMLTAPDKKPNHGSFFGLVFRWPP